MTKTLIRTKKLSAKGICGAVKTHLPRDAEKNIILHQEVKLFRVYGNALGVKKGDSAFGPWVAFQGSFEAVSAISGEITGSNQLFLPEVAELMLYPAVMDSNNVNGVKFSFEIGAKGNESQVGYEYTIRLLSDVAENDVLASMRAEFATPKQQEPQEPKLAPPVTALPEPATAATPVQPSKVKRASNPDA